MTPRERMAAVVKGEPTDRVPYLAWHHFYLNPPAGPNSGMADAELQFYRSFHPDILKVMHDIPYENVGLLETPSDWRTLPVLNPNVGNFGLQLETLRDIRQKLDIEVPMVDTVFGVYFYANEISRGKLLAHFRQDPESVKIGLNAIAESLKLYARATVDAGCEGIFYAVSGASAEGATREEYLTHFRDYERSVLESVSDAPFNILHLHGYEDLYFDLVHDLPASIVNWSDRAAGPTIRAAREIHGGCILGGIDERRFKEMTPCQISNIGRAAIAESGGRSFVLGPGCSVPDNSSTDRLEALADAVGAISWAVN